MSGNLRIGSDEDDAHFTQDYACNACHDTGRVGGAGDDDRDCACVVEWRESMAAIAADHRNDCARDDREAA